jgi:uncharacterized coiled-coil DUF342 family protein
MNAVVRENYEVSMLTDEAIEVHLASLHDGQNELRKDVRELRADNKSLHEKIDALGDRLDRKIDGNFATLDKKIDTLDNKIDGVNTSLGEKITQLSNDVASMRGMQVAMLWLISVLGSLGIVGKFMHWF